MSIEVQERLILTQAAAVEQVPAHRSKTKPKEGANAVIRSWMRGRGFWQGLMIMPDFLRNWEEAVDGYCQRLFEAPIFHVGFPFIITKKCSVILVILVPFL